MPSLMTLFGYKLYFWSNENNPLEPIHIHVSKNPHKNATKIWICKDGPCILDNNNDKIPGKDLKKIINAVNDFSEEIIQAWIDHFGEISYIQEEENIDLD